MIAYRVGIFIWVLLSRLTTKKQSKMTLMTLSIVRWIKIA